MSQSLFERDSRGAGWRRDDRTAGRERGTTAPKLAVSPVHKREHGADVTKCTESHMTE